MIPSFYRTQRWKNLREAILKRDNGKCQYCGKKAYSADHIIPRKRGGPDTMANLVAVCKKCNKKAGGKLFPSFAAKKAYLT